MAKYKDHLKGSFAIALEQAAGQKSVGAALAVMSEWAETELGDRRRKASAERIAEIVSLREDGLSCYAISGRVGLSAPTVRRIARKYGRTRI